MLSLKFLAVTSRVRALGAVLLRLVVEQADFNAGLLDEYCIGSCAVVVTALSL
ncbi:hypothetical protein CGMCC3_g13994 [Colletotrichum fructicola]|nr:uncharacterized protein CGMCC3_g13994 [Colletotrichum fructicola]KAE9569885.1 hypothetical protein CGMCC3_g13994 [Colletotrichum fructicola]